MRFLVFTVAMAAFASLATAGTWGKFDDPWQEQVGYCRDCNGKDQNSGAIASGSLGKEDCLKKCRNHPQALACEIHIASNWCTIYKAKVSQGFPSDKTHICWVPQKNIECLKPELRAYPPTPAPATTLSPKKPLSAYLGCWNWKSRAPGQTWGWPKLQFKANNAVQVMARVGRGDNWKVSDDAAFPASDGWYVLGVNAPRYYMRIMGDGKIHWRKFSIKENYCKNKKFNGKLGYCNDYGDAVSYPCPTTAPPPTISPAKPLSAYLGCWNWKSTAPGQTWGWPKLQFKRGNAVQVMTRVGKGDNWKKSDDNKVFPVSEGWYYLEVNKAKYYMRIMSDGKIHWRKFQITNNWCKNKDYKGKKGYCHDYGSATSYACPTTAPPPTKSPAKPLSAYLGCWNWKSTAPGQTWGWPKLQFKAGNAVQVMTRVGKGDNWKKSDDNNVFPVSEGWYYLEVNKAKYYMRIMSDGKIHWRKFQITNNWCKNKDYKGKKGYCHDYGSATSYACPTTAPPSVDVSFAKNQDNTECGGYKSQGCWEEKPSFVRHDKKLLIYWRYDITWEDIRGFTKSLVCTCAKAAKAAGKKYYAVHFWGECWAINMDDFKKTSGGDCRRDFDKKCNGNDKKMCFADKSFKVYTTE